MLPDSTLDEFPFGTEAFDDGDDDFCDYDAEEERFWKSKKFRQLTVAS